MSQSIRLLATALRAELRGLDPGRLSGEECAKLVPLLAATEKACAAARALLAARAAAAGGHRGAGFRDAADWLAVSVGSSPGVARAELDTARALDDCPVTREAVVAGDLSLAQAGESCRAATAGPGEEAELVALARRSTLQSLRDEVRRRRFAAVDVDALHSAQRAARRVRHWRDDLGMVCGRFALPPDVGVAFVRRLEVETDRVRRRARRTGVAEPREAHAADAFATLVAGAGPGGEGADGRGRRRGRSADVVIVCDLRAWQRGRAAEGEPCHIVGGTPVPVAVAKRLAADAFLKAALHDGKRIDTVVHWGRHIPAEVRTALELGRPPAFDGAACVEPGCGRRHGLEWDHVDPLANRGPTSYANLASRCWPHHGDKTERDRAAGLLGGNPARHPP